MVTRRAFLAAIGAASGAYVMDSYATDSYATNSYVVSAFRRTVISDESAASNSRLVTMSAPSHPVCG